MGIKTTSNDTGSLKVGTTAGDHVWTKGDRLQILGEAKVRTVTFVMGNPGEKLHLCFKSQGIVPTGELEYTLVDAE